METRPRKRIDIIKDLVAEGVLGPEGVPDPDFWWWPVLLPDRIPEEVRGMLWGHELSEIRWYGE